MPSFPHPHFPSPLHDAGESSPCCRRVLSPASGTGVATQSNRLPVIVVAPCAFSPPSWLFASPFSGTMAAPAPPPPPPPSRPGPGSSPCPPSESVELWWSGPDQKRVHTCNRCSMDVSGNKNWEQHVAGQPHLKRCAVLVGGPPPAASGADGLWVCPLCNTKCGTQLMLLSHVEGFTHMKNLGHHIQGRQFDAIDQVAPRLRAARVVAHEQRQDVIRSSVAIEEAEQASRRPGEPDEELEARVACRTTGGGSTNGGRSAVGSGRGPSCEAGHGRGNRRWGGHLQTGSRPSTGACGRPGGAAHPRGGSRWRDDDGKARSSYGGDGGGPSGGGGHGRGGEEHDRHAGSGYGGGGGGPSSGSRHVGGSWQNDASSPGAYGGGGGGPSGSAPRPRGGSRWDEEEHSPSAYGRSGCVSAYRVLDGRGRRNWEDARRHHERGYGGGAGGPSRGS